MLFRSREYTGTTALTLTLQKPHYPSKIATTLASLVKGRWLDGKTQALILLLSVCDTSAFFIHQIFLPSRRRDCSPSAPSMRFSALSLKNRHHPCLLMNALLISHYPLLCTITLASPRKRGGGTADIIFGLAVQYSDSPAFTILKLFRAVTVGIAPHPHHH